MPAQNVKLQGVWEMACSYRLEGNTLWFIPRANNTDIPITNQKLMLHRIADL